MLRATLMLLALCVATHAMHNPSWCNISLANIGLSAESQVFFPSNSSWANETIRWTEYMPPTYSVAIRPTLESDVQALVRQYFVSI